MGMGGSTRWSVFSRGDVMMLRCGPMRKKSGTGYIYFYNADREEEERTSDCAISMRKGIVRINIVMIPDAIVVVVIWFVCIKEPRVGTKERG